MRLVNIDPLIQEGWVLERHGVSNTLLAVKSLADVPTIEAEPVRHGRWISVDGTPKCDEWDCSACEERHTFFFEMEEDDMHENFRYCPNCGCKMDLEGE